MVVSQGFAPRLSPSKGDVLLLHHETAKTGGICLCSTVHRGIHLVSEPGKRADNPHHPRNPEPYMPLKEQPLDACYLAIPQNLSKRFCFSKKSQVCFSQTVHRGHLIPREIIWWCCLIPLCSLLNHPLQWGEPGKSSSAPKQTKNRLIWRYHPF